MGPRRSPSFRVFAAFLLCALAAAWPAAARAEAPDSPAADVRRANERALAAVHKALAEVRMLSERTPAPKERPQCALLSRPEAWLHAPGKAPLRRMSVGAAVSSAADALGWRWSHALPSAVLYMDLDFGPARRALSGAQWLCEIDRLSGGLLRLQMYPSSRHLFVARRMFARPGEEEAAR